MLPKERSVRLESFLRHIGEATEDVGLDDFGIEGYVLYVKICVRQFRSVRKIKKATSFSFLLPRSSPLPITIFHAFFRHRPLRSFTLPRFPRFLHINSNDMSNFSSIEPSPSEVEIKKAVALINSYPSGVHHPNNKENEYPLNLNATKYEKEFKDLVVLLKKYGGGRSEFSLADKINITRLQQYILEQVIELNILPECGFLNCNELRSRDAMFSVTCGRCGVSSLKVTIKDSGKLVVRRANNIKPPKLVKYADCLGAFLKKSSNTDQPDMPSPGDYDEESGCAPPVDDDSNPHPRVKEETGASNASDHTSSDSLRDPTLTQVTKLKDECIHQAGVALRLLYQITENLMSERYSMFTSKFPLSILQEARKHVYSNLAAAMTDERVDVLQVALKSLRGEVEELREIYELIVA